MPDKIIALKALEHRLFAEPRTIAHLGHRVPASVNKLPRDFSTPVAAAA